MRSPSVILFSVPCIHPSFFAHFPITHQLGRAHSFCVSAGRLLFATRTLRLVSRETKLPVHYRFTFRKSGPILTD